MLKDWIVKQKMLEVAVVTVKSNIESRDWSLEAIKERMWGEHGIIIASSNSHGLVYKVYHHRSRTTAWYEPRELRLLDVPDYRR